MGAGRPAVDPGFASLRAVIVGDDELAQLAGEVTMVSGGFDPLHPGHVGYFTAAAALGRPLLVNVSDDAWVARKHAPLLTQLERAELIDALGVVDYVHLESRTTAEAIRAIRPYCFVKGSDWDGRLPAEEAAACEELGVRVAFVDTVTSSSSDILKRFLETQKDREIDGVGQQWA